MNEWYGPHYHIFAALLGAWMTAHVIRLLQDWRPRGPALAWLAVWGVFVAGQYAAQVRARHDPELPASGDPAVTATGNALRRIALPGELIVVRSEASSRAEELFGGGANNYQDPRIFYLSRTRGWVLPRDSVSAGDLERLVGRGARHYVETYIGAASPCRGPDPSETRDSPHRWLEQNARLVSATPCGRIYSFESVGGV